MEAINYRDVELISTEEGKGKMRLLINEETGAKNFELRLNEKNPGLPGVLHKHPWEHIVFILEGEAIIYNGIEQKAVAEGDAIFLPPNEPHQIRNEGNKTLKFLNIMPLGVDMKKVSHP